MHDKVIFDFSKSSGIQGWQVVNDGVMGGLSKGSIRLTEEGHALYRGDVSLENNGGFSSVRYRLPKMDVSEFENICFRVKGDGKRYQFRLKEDAYDRHSFITYFETSGDWEEICLPLSEFYPTFRGNRLRMDNFQGSVLGEIGLLIGNKQAEPFAIHIDRISLR
jgi:hypothetical protein